MTSERLILHTYRKFGAAALPELHGDFSFTLWNSLTRKLVAFRDLTGSRPFFYAHHDGTLTFSNTMQAVLAVPTGSRELDEGFLADFLLGSPYLNPGSSVYRSIRRLPPGHLLEFSGCGLSIRRIANIPVEELLIFKRSEEYVEEFKRLLFLPWLEPVSLREGEICSVELHSNLVGNDYVWRWETDLPASSAHGQLCFRQSTFYGSLFPPSPLKKRTMDFVPVLNESGQAERWILQAMDGKRPLEAIAAEAARLFPHVFRRVEDAFNQAAEIAKNIHTEISLPYLAYTTSCLEPVLAATIAIWSRLPEP